MAITTKTAAAPEKAGDKDAKVAPATGFNPSGAPDQTSDIDVGHPAVDNDPREGSTVDMNSVDFNDPTKTPEEAVVDNLKG